MATLLLRLAAPMQAWGDESKYDIRQTWQTPSKSGVIGLVAAAFGLHRDSEEIPALSGKLRMGIRVEMPGQVIMDYQSVHSPKRNSKNEVCHKADMSIDFPDDIPHKYETQRYYLCDACFLVGLESEDEELLDRLEEALGSPCFPLYLGRRSCPPALPLCLGIRHNSLDDALRKEPWQASDWYRRQNTPSRLRMVLETAKGTAAWHSLRDEPVSFSPIHRMYSYRGVEPEQYVTLNDGSHDPMAELQE